MVSLRKMKVKIFSKKICKRISYAVGREFSEFKYIPTDVYGNIHQIVPMEDAELFIKVSSISDSSDESFIPIPTYFIESIIED